MIDSQLYRLYRTGTMNFYSKFGCYLVLDRKFVLNIENNKFYIKNRFATEFYLRDCVITFGNTYYL